MDLRNLSNEVLDENLLQLVRREREVIGDILLHVREVDRRKMYLDFAYPNLFSYVNEHLGYQGGSAQRRIDAARLSKEIPGVLESIETGDLNLSHVTIVQKAVRQVFKESQIKITQEQKQEVLKQISGKSLEDSQMIVAQTFEIQPEVAPRLRRQADESMRLEISFTKDQWAKLEQMRTLLSHSLPSSHWDDVFEYVADRVIQQKSKLGPKVKANGEVTQANAKHATIKSLSEGNQRASIPANIKRAIFQRDQCCQFVDGKTKRKCSSKWRLQVDHIKPVWAEGGHAMNNLQLLCANHNRNRYLKQAGIRAV